VFEMADQALDFVLSKIDLSVGTRAESVRVPVKYELPKAAIAEAIVNAIAHRDYASHASTQIMLFADRLEIWNPGQLPLPLTFESLLDAHPSIPRNPLIAEAMYLARYIERAGTGTLDITRLCKAAKL
ncbi:MAG: ATP-binding protein, partial [Planctomyces sp.]